MKKSPPLKNQFLKFSPYVPELLGFETMLIIYPYGMAIHARVVAGLVFSLLFKLVSSYCDSLVISSLYDITSSISYTVNL